jgi:hypothetical protein
MANMKALPASLCSLLILGVCAAGEEKVGGTANAISTTIVMAHRAAAEVLDKAPPDVPVDLAAKECLRELEVGQIDEIVQAYLATRLDAEEMRVADAFFASTSGQKYIADGEINAYKAVGLVSSKTSVKRTPEEQGEYDTFFASSAGRNLLLALSDHTNFTIPLNQQVLSIVQTCAKQRQEKRQAAITHNGDSLIGNP